MTVLVAVLVALVVVAALVAMLFLAAFILMLVPAYLLFAPYVCLSIAVLAILAAVSLRLEGQLLIDQAQSQQLSAHYHQSKFVSL